MQTLVELIYLLIQGGLYTCIVCKFPQVILFACERSSFTAANAWRKAISDVTHLDCPESMTRQMNSDKFDSKFLTCRLHVRLPKGRRQILLGECHSGVETLMSL